MSKHLRTRLLVACGVAGMIGIIVIFLALMTTPTIVHVTNKSKDAVFDIDVVGGGDSAKITSLSADETKTVQLHPTHDGVVVVSFALEDRRQRFASKGRYLSYGIGGVMHVEVDSGMPNK